MHAGEVEVVTLREGRLEKCGWMGSPTAMYFGHDRPRLSQPQLLSLSRNYYKSLICLCQYSISLFYLRYRIASDAAGSRDSR
jgi:hypothetical protein